MITREALRILHQKLNFVSKTQRQYDDRFAQSGAKIGQTLNIRKPNRYTVSTGAALSTQDTTETSVALAVSTQKHVDTTFSSVELTMSLQDFSERILEPGIAQLAASIEADALTMYKQVYNQVGNAAQPLNSMTPVLQARKRLKDNLVPAGRYPLILNTDSNVTLVSGLQGLFQSASEIAEQYEEGMMGRTAGFDFYENTLLSNQTSAALGGTPIVASGGQTGSSLATSGWTPGATVLKQGDVFTIGSIASNGVFGVHKETRQPFGYLQQFVATADVVADGGGLATIPISPPITVTGPYQTVGASPANGAAITGTVAATTTYGVNLGFHRDAFAFATADLEDVSQFGAWGAREVFEGISMRIARQYAIGTDTVPCRIDVLYGYVATYPELACRIANQPQTT